MLCPSTLCGVRDGLAVSGASALCVSHFGAIRVVRSSMCILPQFRSERVMTQHMDVSFLAWGSGGGPAASAGFRIVIIRLISTIVSKHLLNARESL